MNDRQTVRITDPEHPMYGRVAVVLQTTEWYTHVRVLYHNDVQILTSDQFVFNVRSAE